MLMAKGKEIGMCSQLADKSSNNLKHTVSFKFDADSAQFEDVEYCTEKYLI